MHHPDEKCQHWLGALSEYADGSLDATLCAELERHMSDCENCRIVVDTLRKTIFLYHATIPEPDVPGDIRERLFQKLDLDDFTDKEKE